MTKCYFAHGGNELVIGGKLTFLPGAVPSMMLKSSAFGQFDTR